MKTIKRLIIALVAVYLLGTLFFSIFTYPSTHINGNEIGFVTKDEALRSFDKGHTIEIKGRDDKTDIIKAQDISFNKILKPGQKLEQNPLLWPIGIFLTHNYHLVYDVSYDQDKLDGYLKNSVFMEDMIEPKDARLVPDSSGFTIEEEELGSTLDVKAAGARIVEAFTNGEKEISFDDEYIKPSITKDSNELKDRMDVANSLSQMTVTFDMGEDKIELEGDKLLDMYLANGSEFTPIRDQAHEYVRQLAIEYDTFSPDQERDFTTSHGNNITVVGGIYGWQMDVDATTDEFIEILKDKESKTIVPTYLVEGLTRSKDDLKDTYIEISIQDQHLWFYKDGDLIVDTDIVTGDPTRGVSTHTGVGKVWSKEEDKTLVGIVPEGTSDYASYVDFWMPINWDNEGIHNSTWRESFGGSIYQGNGSYGCVNLPYDPTKTIFENVELNTPVVVY